MLRAGIIGLGTVAYIHKLVIEASPHAELTAVCDLDPVRTKDYGEADFYQKIEDFLAQADLDVVHICLPHHLHAPVARRVLESGRHVLLEKPLALSYREGKELADFARGRKEKLGICFQNRYNRTTEMLYDLVHGSGREKSGKVKAVKGIVTWFRAPSYYEAEPWRGRLAEAGAGTIINQSIHTLDLMAYFAGHPENGKGQLMSLMDYPVEVEDTAVAEFSFSSGASGLYFATNGYAENSPVHFQVVTEHARYVIDDYSLYELTAKGRVRLCEDDQMEATKSYYGMGHDLCINKFYQAIKNDSSEYISADAALDSMMMIDMMRRSTQTGRRIEQGEIANG